MYREKCIECGQQLEQSHSKSRITCSPKCRKRRERRQKDAHSAFYLAMHELQKMRDSIKRGEQVEDLRSQLIQLKNEINDLLILAKDRDALARLEMLESRAQRR